MAKCNTTNNKIEIRKLLLNLMVNKLINEITKKSRNNQDLLNLTKSKQNK